MKYFKLSIILFILITSIQANSAPLRFVEITVNQPDGTELQIYASGDEFYNWLHDKDGYTIIQDPATGYYVYAQLVGQQFEPTNLKVGLGEPASINLNKWEMLPQEVIHSQSSSLRETQQLKAPQLKGYNKTQAKNQGKINNIVVFIRFAGEAEFTDNISVFDNMFNQPNANSMYQYFKDVSYNTLDITSTFYPIPAGTTVLSYQDIHPRGYYQPHSTSNTIGYTGGNNGTQRRDREHILLKRAIDSVKHQIPATLNLDYNNDGNVDNVCFIVSGSPTGWSSLLWPHMWVLFSQVATINGKRVWEYNFQIRSSTLSAGNGVLCHEMFHTLGAPDLYHYTSNGISPVGQWDLMENNTNPPQSMGTYMKMKYGNWIQTIPQITTEGIYTLNPITSPTNNAFKIASPYSASEYFVVEYRRKQGLFENSIPGTGLLVYRINPSVNGNANGPPDEVYIYRPNGTITVNGTINSAHFSQSVNRMIINDNTNPSSFLTNGSPGGLRIDSVGIPGETITFKIGFVTEPIPILTTPLDNSTGITLTPVLNWQVFPGATSYHLQISTTPDFIQIISNQGTVSGINYAVPSGLLGDNKKYFWRVRANVAGGQSGWSAVFNFTTISRINITNVSGIFCAGSPITISYTVNQPFETTNVFIAEISDSLGSFVRQNIIGLHGSNTSGSFQVVLPDTLPGGSRYRIRISASAPPAISPDNGQNLVISPLLMPIIGNYTENVCTDNINEYFTSQVPGVTNKWTIKGGKVIGRNDSTSITIHWGNVGFGEIKLVQTSSRGCIDSTISPVLIRALPEPMIISGDSIVCLNSSTVYSCNQGEGLTNKWLIIGGRVTQIISNDRVRITWNEPGNGKIILYQFNSVGCVDSVSINVQISAGPIATVSGENSACQKVQYKYFTNYVDNSSNLWKAVGGNIVGRYDLDSVVVVWNQTGIGTITLTKTNLSSNCPSIVEHIVDVQPLPSAEIYGAISPCQMIEYEYYTTNIEDTESYWTSSLNPYGEAKKGERISFVWTETGSQYLILTRYHSSGCKDSIRLNLTVYEAPEKPVITQSGDSLKSSVKNENHIWYFNGNAISGETKSFIKPTATGKYTCVAISKQGCESQVSEEFDFIGTSVDYKYGNSISIYPNPTKDILNISLRQTELAASKIELFNQLGLLLATFDTNNMEFFSLDLKNYPQGIYNIVIHTNNSIITNRIAIVR